jgi:MATE family, multidrug efflux pump
MRLENGWREIIVLATPVVISKLSFTAMGIVDTAMVGRLGATEQGAVGIATTFMFTLYVFGLGLLGVVNTFVSQNHGAGRLRTCGFVLGQGLRIAVVVGAVTWAAIALSYPLIRLSGLGDGVSELGYRYLFYRSLGLPAVFGYWVYNGYMEGLGKTRTPMLITIAANAVNIVGDYVLIFGLGPIPAMGVDGAGIATALSNSFMLVCFVVVVHRRGSSYRAFGAAEVRRRWHGSTIRKMFRIGLPMGFQFFGEIGAFLLFSVMIGWINDTALAANQVALRLLSISFMTGWGISVAATTLVGRHQGEKRPDLAEIAARRCLQLMLGIAAVLGVAFATAAEPLSALFSPFPEVVYQAALLVLVASVFQVFDAVNMVAYGALKGAGDTRWPLWVVIFVNWGIGVPAVYLLTFTAGLGAVGAWLGMSAMIGVQGALLALRFRSGRWKQMRVVDDEAEELPEIPELPGGASRNGAVRRSA